MDSSIKTYGKIGFIVVSSDQTFDDDSRSFESWKKEHILEGRSSSYTERKNSENPNRRRRKLKTDFSIQEIKFYEFDATSIQSLASMRQGQSSNTKPRKNKYGLNMRTVEPKYLIKILPAVV